MAETNHLKNFIKKYLVKITFIVAVTGFLTEISGFLPDWFLSISLHPINFVKSILPFNNFYFLGHFTTFSDFSSQGFVNYFSVCFYLLLFTAAYLYRKNKVNYRLLIFLSFIVLLLNIIVIISALFLVPNISCFNLIIFISKSLIWIIFSSVVIKILNNKTEFEEGEFQGMRLAPAWHRFVNQFVDVFTCYFLVLGTPIGDFLFSFIFDFNGLEAVVIYVFYIFYCFVFEFLLNATPSKYLTQSRLIAVEPVKLNVSTVLLRTVCRVIPFEAWSFLFAKAGWHDSLSNTRVVKTKPDAVKSGKLFLIIIIVAVASGLPFLINWGSRELIENNHYEKERNARFEELVNRAENLNGKSGLFIKKQDNYRTEFLLVKNIDNNIVEAYLVPHEMGVVERFTQEELVSFINRNDAMLETVRFSLNDLIEVVKDNGQTYHKIEKNSPFRIQNYEVEKIFNFEEPMLNVSSNSTSSDNDEFSRNITIENKGWFCYLHEVEIIKGVDYISGDWDSPGLPYKIEGSPYKSHNAKRTMFLIKYPRNKKFEIKLHFKSVAGKEYVYEVSGINFNYKINLLK